MSLALLIDGYNVIAPVAPPGRAIGSSWLQRERTQLVSRLVKHLESEMRARTCVVFDAADPPKDRPSQFVVDGVEVRFSVGYPTADDLLEELIVGHSSPKQLAVVSSDHRVQNAARRRRCTVFESQDWLDALLEGKVGVAPSRRRGSGQGRGAERSDKDEPAVSGHEVSEWMRKFGF